ncbi:hypothetical protein ACLMJK_006161 [Lecanora helva]
MSSRRPVKLEGIREDLSDLLKKQGFLTDNDCKRLLPDPQRQIFQNINLGGLEGGHLTLFKKLRILLILIDIRIPSWDKVYHALRTIEDRRLPLAEKHLEFLGTRDRNDFLSRQWQYIPRVIKEGEGIEEEIYKGSVLPFDKSLRRELGKGVSGNVYKESIPAGYYRDRNDRYNTEAKIVARKVFKLAIDHVEIKNLQVFRESRDTQNCIMTCLAILVARTDTSEEYSIIMDKADTDLWKYLPYTASRKDFTASLRDLLSEAAEFAGALAWLHERIQVEGKRYVCCHMDLKPDNVLLFDVETERYPVGKWKIADFGLSTIRTPQERLSEIGDSHHGRNVIETIITTAKRKSGAYTAPEFFTNPDKVGRSCDLWSYGCILVDIIASQLLDESSLCHLTSKRSRADDESRSDDWFYTKGSLNPNVQAWMETLNENCVMQYQSEIVALPSCKQILTDVLIVNPNDRPRLPANSIRDRLIDVCKLIGPSQPTSGSLPYRPRHKTQIPQPIDLLALENNLRDTQRPIAQHLDERSEADAMLLSNVQKWICDPRRKVLWIDGPLPISMRHTSPFSSGLHDAALKVGFPVMSYICRREIGGSSVRLSKVEVLVDLIYSLIHKLQTFLNEDIARSKPVSQETFNALNGIVTLSTAMSVLAELWAAVDVPWFCVIDGFDIIEDGTDKKLAGQIYDLIGILNASSQQSSGNTRSPSKTLITTFGKSIFLGKRLSSDSKMNTGATSKSKSPILKDLTSAMEKFKEMDLGGARTV